MTTVTVKHCPQCGLDLPIRMFGKDARQADGYARVCKMCRSEYSKKRYYLNRRKEFES